MINVIVELSVIELEIVIGVFITHSLQHDQPVDCCYRKANINLNRVMYIYVQVSSDRRPNLAKEADAAGELYIPQESWSFSSFFIIFFAWLPRIHFSV